MIERVMDDLAAEVETVEICKVEEEEEGLSSTTWKDSNDGGNADVEDQTEVSPKDQVEHQGIFKLKNKCPSSWRE